MESAEFFALGAGLAGLLCFYLFLEAMSRVWKESFRLLLWASLVPFFFGVYIHNRTPLVEELELKMWTWFWNGVDAFTLKVPLRDMYQFYRSKFE